MSCSTSFVSRTPNPEHEQRQPLERRNENVQHHYSERLEFSFTELFETKEQCTSTSQTKENFQTKDIKPLSHHKAAVFVSYLQPLPAGRVPQETVTVKEPYKESKKPPLKRSSRAQPSSEEKCMMAIIHSTLQKPTDCFFAMDEHYEEAKHLLKTSKEMQQEPLVESSSEEELLPLQRCSWSDRQTI